MHEDFALSYQLSNTHLTEYVNIRNFVTSQPFPHELMTGTIITIL